MEFLFYLFLAYCAGSAAEWFGHAILMHRRTSGFVGVYNLHMEHHRAYPRNYFQWSVDEGTYKGLVLCLEHIMVFMLPLALLALPFKPLLSLALVTFGVVHFFLYNAIHPAEHLMHRPWFMPTRMFEALCFYHFVHHQQPTKNFNVTLPGFDYIMGTAGKPTYNDLKEWVGVRNVIRSNYPSSKVDRDNLKKLDNCLLSPKSWGYMRNGYIAPAPGFEASLVGYKLLTLMKFLFIGDIKVEGIQNIVDGSAVYACSHHSWKDLFIIRYVLSDVRIMAALSVMRFLGLGFILGPFLGCFGAEGDGKGTAVKSSISLLKDGKSQLAICPSGWAYLNKREANYRNGVARIVKGAGVPVIPVFIDYNASPEPDWFIKLPFPLQVALNALNPLQRKGCTVKIGEPITDLPEDVEDCTRFIEYKVKKLGGWYGQ